MLLHWIDFEKVSSVNKKLIFDAMHGSGAGYLKPFLSQHDLILIRENQANPETDDLPEPIPANLKTTFKSGC